MLSKVIRPEAAAVELEVRVPFYILLRVAGDARGGSCGKFLVRPAADERFLVLVQRFV